MPSITFTKWLSKRNRSEKIGGMIIQKLKQSDHPERLVLALFTGKLSGVSKDEWEAVRRLVWKFRRDGGVFTEGEEARADGAPVEPGSVVATFGPTGKRRGRQRKVVITTYSDDELSNALIDLWGAMGFDFEPAATAL